MCLLLAVLVGVVFGQTLQHGFLNYDDPAYVTENELVRGGLSVRGVARAFATVHTFTWHPLTTLSHMLDFELHGLDPAGHHLSSVLLHAATAILLYLVLRRATRARGPSAFAALVFAVHPLRVESVAWISERKDVLSGLFFVATLGAYARYAEVRQQAGPRAGRWYLATLVGFVLALLSKPSVVALPFVLLLLDRWPLERLGTPQRPLRDLRARLVEKLPFFALAAGCGAVALATQKGAMTSVETLPVSERIGNALVSYAVYLRQLFVPLDLALVYPHAKGSLPAAEVGLAGLLLAGLTAATLALRRRAPFLIVGWLWFLGMLVPVIGLIQVGVQAHADRYTYLPHVGLCLMLSFGLAAGWPATLDRRWSIVPAVLVVAGLVLLARRQTAHWRTSEAIWRHTLACTAQNSVAHAQLGVALEDTGRVDEAVEHYRAAIAIQDDYATPRYNLGNVLAARGDLDGAIAQYELAIRARPDYAKAHNNLGAALAARGRMPEALAAFARAVEAEPDYLEGRLGYAAALVAVGKVEDALAQYRELLRSNPGSAAAHNGLGALQARLGRMEEAIASYREALRLDPGFAEAHGNLAIALGGQNRLAEALAHFRRAAELEPGSPTRQGNLAMALEMGGDPSALEHYRRAAELAEARGDAGLAAAMRERVRRYGAAPSGR